MRCSGFYSQPPIYLVANQTAWHPPMLQYMLSAHSLLSPKPPLLHFKEYQQDFGGHVLGLIYEELLALDNQDLSQMTYLFT